MIPLAVDMDRSSNLSNTLLGSRTFFVSELHIKENQVKGDKILLKLKTNGHAEIHSYVNEAYNGLKEANDIRNSLAHKFSKLSSDRRGTISDDGRSYGASAGHFIDYPSQVEILDRSLKYLRDFFFSIRGSMMQIHQLELDDWAW